MKKQILNLSLLGLLTLGLFSCTKEDTKITASNPSSSAPSNLMVFESVDAYESLFEDPSTTDQKVNTIAARFGTYNGGASRVGSILEDTLYPEFLQKILNDDYIVQIDNWLIKVDAAKEQVLALEINKSNEYVDLAKSNLNNKNIQVYSTNDDVINMLKNGVLTNAKLFCKDNGAEPKQNDGDAIANINFLTTSQSSSSSTVELKKTRYYIETRYLRLGIYFELKCKAYNSWFYGVALNATGKYKIACEDKDVPFDQWEYVQINDSGDAVCKPYIGSKKLTKYSLTAKAFTKSNDYYSNQSILATPSRNISYGY